LWIATCPTSGSSLSPAHSWPFCFSSPCLLKVHAEISSLRLLPSQVCLQDPTSSAVCSLSFPYLLFRLFFFAEWGVSLSRGLCWFIPRVAVGMSCDAWCSLVGLSDVSQAGVEPVSGSAGTLLFSWCNVVWRSFIWARGSGCQSFDSSWCFIATKCGSSISARFLIYGAQTVCFCTLVAILDPYEKLLFLSHFLKY
jgi:hypothetical protein